MASVRERTSASGERTWQVLYRHGGRQASKTFATPKTAEQFRALVDALTPDGALKALSERDETGLSIGELAEAFLTWKAGKVTERTMTDYRRDVANWIAPWFGHRAAEAIDEGDVQRWVDHMAERLAPKSVADRHMLLHSMYEYGRAKSRRLVEHNPCKETELPKKGKRGIVKAMPVPAYRALHEAAVRRNPDAADLILFLGSTGWRWSEAAALPAISVEDDGSDIWVTVTRVFRLDASGRQFIAEDEAKSQAAFRRIRPTSGAHAMLRRRLVGKAPGDLIFTNSRGRAWNQNTWLRDTWPSLCEAAGLDPRPTPHQIRHMHVAVILAAGGTLPEVQRRVGHESIQTTINVYGSGIGDVSSDALEAAEAILTGRRSTLGDVVTGELVRPTRELEAP